MNQTKKYNEARLPNGLRIIHETSDSDVVYCGYVVCAGTRHEEEKDTGMAHFLEHMSFKGTSHRKSYHISNGLERVGGDLNAYTNKQETVYYATVLRDDFLRAVDILSDMIFHSTYPQIEINKEVEVICDEIDSYRDSPADLIFDEFEAMVFKGHPLGRDILGSAERLRTYRTADAQRFASKYYVPSNCVFFVLGNLDFKKIVKAVEKYTIELLGSEVLKPAQPLPVYEPMERIVDKETHQVHVIIGGRAFGGNDGRRFDMFLLNNILGGPGMNSRLNMSLREKAGLVYSVDSSYSVYPDTGAWSIYFGCDHDDLDKCRRLVLKELKKMIDKKLSSAQLAAAKKQLKGQVGISCDSSENYALAMGKTYALYGLHRDVPKLKQAIDDLTSESLQETASEVLNPDGVTTLIYR